jgi:hypothetical protein
VADEQAALRGEVAGQLDVGPLQMALRAALQQVDARVEEPGSGVRQHGQELHVNRPPVGGLQSAQQRTELRSEAGAPQQAIEGDDGLLRVEL